MDNLWISRGQFNIVIHRLKPNLWTAIPRSGVSPTQTNRTSVREIKLLASNIQDVGNVRLALLVPIARYVALYNKVKELGE